MGVQLCNYPELHVAGGITHCQHADLRQQLLVWLWFHGRSDSEHGTCVEL